MSSSTQSSYSLPDMMSKVIRRKTVGSDCKFSPLSAITFDIMSGNEYEDCVDEDMHPYISEEEDCHGKDDDNEGDDEEDGLNKELDKEEDNQSGSESDKYADETVPPSDGEEDEGLSQCSLKSLRLTVNNVLDFLSQEKKKETSDK